MSIEHSRYARFEDNCSVEVRIVNPFVFLVIYMRLSLNFNAYIFGHCVIFLGKKITAPPPQVRVCSYASGKAAMVLRELIPYRCLFVFSNQWWIFMLIILAYFYYSIWRTFLCFCDINILAMTSYELLLHTNFIQYGHCYITFFHMILFSNAKCKSCISYLKKMRWTATVVSSRV